MKRHSSQPRSAPRPSLRRVGWRQLVPAHAVAVVALVVAFGVGLGLLLSGHGPEPARREAVQVPIEATPPQLHASRAPVLPSPPPSSAAPAPSVEAPPALPKNPPDETATALLRPPEAPQARRSEPAPPAGTPAWLRYAVPAPHTAGKAVVAIVIDDLGLDRKGAEEVMRLPAPLTLSLMTYAPDLTHLTAAGREAGHELMMHVPMEALDPHQDPGTNGLFVGLGRDEILRRLRWGLDRANGYVGINNHMGSKFTSNAQAMMPVIEEVKARGLLFLDSRTAASTVGEQLARQVGVPTAARDVFLDDEISTTAISARLAELEQVAHRRGSAIAIGHPHGPTIAALAAWLPTLANKGLVLVPLSAVVRQRGATG